MKVEKVFNRGEIREQSWIIYSRLDNCEFQPELKWTETSNFQYQKIEYWKIQKFHKSRFSNFINRIVSKQFAMHLVGAIFQMTKYTFFDSKILRY